MDTLLYITFPKSLQYSNPIALNVLKLLKMRHVQTIFNFGSMKSIHHIR
jgi:hypothetical protein